MRVGNLAEIPFAVVLHALAVHERTSVLEIERGPMTKQIFFEDGLPVECRSNMLHETLSRFMVSRGLLDSEKEQELFNKSVAQGLQFGELLIVEGLMSASELYKLLQQNLAKKLLDGFSWRSGEFRILEEEPEVDSPLKVKAAQLVVTGIGKFALAEEVNSAISPLVGKKLFLHPSPVFPLDEIRLPKDQMQITRLLEGGKRIDELAAETPVPFDQIMRLLYSLAVIGVVVPEERLPKEPVPKKKPVAEELKETQTLQVPVQPPQDTEKEHNRLMEAYLRYRKQDAFDLLGVPEDAAIELIERRYLGFCRRYAPWKFDVPGLENLVEKAEDLFFAGARAFGELTDGERRKTLIMRRRTLRQEAQTKKPARDRFRIQSKLLDPAVQFKKGKALMERERYKEAEQQLQFAYDCDPQNSTYRAELAYCRFRRDPDRQGEATLEELKETLRVDSRCSLAIYYAGLVSGELEYWDQAEEYLRQAIKLMMPDRRPIEGLKELQERRKKKKKGFFG